MNNFAQGDSAHSEFFGTVIVSKDEITFLGIVNKKWVLVRQESHSARWRNRRR
jgi:hypothetical protein